MGYEVSTGGAYAVLFSVLGVFTILAIISAGYGASFLSSGLQNLLVAQKQPIGGSDNFKERITVASAGSAGGVLATDFFL
jgi:hypothetical protein